MSMSKFLLPLSLIVACGPQDITAAEAVVTASELTGGTATEATAVTEDEHDLWRVEVSMENSATLEVLLYTDSGKLFEIADPEGPFDYDLSPLPGLSYADAQGVAFGEVSGEQRFWEVKDTGERYFYEFYVEDSAAQLWEIKLWADDGEVFVTEAKSEID